MPDWGHVCDSVIARVCSENPGKSNEELRKLCNDAYPFGERSMHPYKIWCNCLTQRFGPSASKIRGIALKRKLDREKLIARGLYIQPLEGMDAH